ncbi:unnamed protein product [Trypanosoma congolense IL3000]|uniref:WGS project CAEQ00000000 data, annotated contig 1713 n=1 Tax=Trypanosoma congolense (strain IL3000) TaxID=1068625 RepID=F9W877_TRYCI|nr:unnamed protein product [Trypanosoma congolense IL3000]
MMENGMKYVAVFILFLLRCPSGMADKENAGEAELFCQIRLLAENDPHKLVFRNEEREKQILRRIERIGPEIRRFVGEAHRRDASLIARFNVIVKGVKKLMGNVRDLRRKAAEKRLSAKRHLHQVIFGDYGGEGKGELDTTPETVKKIFNGNTFKDSCGGNGDKMAGKSLINDFICLCAKWIQLDAVFNSHQDHSICKYGVTTAMANDFKNWTDVWYFNKHRICINTAPFTPTPKIINSIVAHFTRALEREQHNFQVEGVFGYVKTESNSQGECNTTNVGSTCVNYKYALKNGGIQWVNRLKNASKDLEDMERLNKKSESSLPQLELLEHNAILLYEEAKYSTQLPHANETAFKSTNESYEDILTNDTNTLEKLEEEDDSDSTWKGGPSLCGFFFFLFVF